MSKNKLSIFSKLLIYNITIPLHIILLRVAISFVEKFSMNCTMKLIQAFGAGKMVKISCVEMFIPVGPDGKRPPSISFFYEKRDSKILKNTLVKPPATMAYNCNIPS